MASLESLITVLSGAYLWVAFVVVLLLAINFRIGKENRLAARSTLWIFGLSTLGLILAGVLNIVDQKAASYSVRSLCLLANGLCIIRLTALLVFRRLLPRLTVVIPMILQDLILAGFSLVWLMGWLQLHSVDLSSLIAPSAIITAIIGLSLQDTLGNVIGGMALQIEDSIQVGDWVKVDDVVGRVAEVRWRYTAIETRNWDTVIVPNSTLLKGKFQILGRRTGEAVQTRRWVWFYVDFKYDPPRVVDTVMHSLLNNKIENMAAHPPPNCQLMDISESTAKYAVRYHLTNLAVDDPTDSVVRVHIHFALKRAGIPLAVPIYSVHMTEETKKREKRRIEQEQAHRLEAIRQVEIFSCLSDAELLDMSHHLVPAPFHTGEIMTRQGATANWLYIITHGHAEAILDTPDGRQIKVAEFHAGQVFGEMGLLTGSPRTATVVARDLVECYRLDKEAFQTILRNRPEIAREISHLLQKRQKEQASALSNHAATAAGQVSQPEEFLDRIRQFFGLD